MTQQTILFSLSLSSCFLTLILPSSTPVLATGQVQETSFTRFSAVNPIASIVMTTATFLQCASNCRADLVCFGFCYNNQSCELYTSYLTKADPGDKLSMMTVYYRTDAPQATTTSPTTTSSTTTSTTTKTTTSSLSEICATFQDFEVMNLANDEYCVRVINYIKRPGDDAILHCQQYATSEHNVFVIVLDSRAKLDAFRNLLVNRGELFGDYWVGLYDTIEEGNFFWAKKSINVRDQVWGSGQPNGGRSGQPDQDCALLELFGYLKDKPCNEYHYFACQVDLD